MGYLSSPCRSRAGCRIPTSHSLWNFVLIEALLAVVAVRLLALILLLQVSLRNNQRLGITNTREGTSVKETSCPIIKSRGSKGSQADWPDYPCIGWILSLYGGDLAAECMTVSIPEDLRPGSPSSYLPFLGVTSSFSTFLQSSASLLEGLSSE